MRVQRKVTLVAGVGAAALPLNSAPGRARAVWLANCCIFRDLNAASEQIGCNLEALSASISLEDRFGKGCDNIETREFVRNYAAPALNAALGPDASQLSTPVRRIFR
jgi:hypothetical protein